MISVRAEMDDIAEALNKQKTIAGIKDGFGNGPLTAAQEDFLRRYKPHQHLIVYGTLAPGQSNYHMIAHIRGEWRPAVIRGKLVFLETGPTKGYPAFSPAATGHALSIESFVFSSDCLVAHWPALDEFEGEGYRRILIRYEPENGDFGYGYVYALNEE